MYFVEPCIKCRFFLLQPCLSHAYYFSCIANAKLSDSVFPSFFFIEFFHPHCIPGLKLFVKLVFKSVNKGRQFVKLCINMYRIFGGDAGLRGSFFSVKTARYGVFHALPLASFIN